MPEYKSSEPCNIHELPMTSNRIAIKNDLLTYNTSITAYLSNERDSQTNAQWTCAKIQNEREHDSN
jgi:hypothetical protein